ncbi:MAG TPA: GNAT family N-acetyltransferase [Gemmatimonadaceae bacterium]|jgi:Acetyltransferases
MADSQLEVRRATPEDAGAIVRLAVEVQAFHAAARPDVFTPSGSESVPEVVERMGSDVHLYWVATDGEDVIGYVYAKLSVEPETRWHWSARILTLVQMGVAERYQRQGAGRRLWEAVRQAATERRVDRVMLNVWAFNTPARRFYEQMGFAPFSERMALELGSG